MYVISLNSIIKQNLDIHYYIIINISQLYIKKKDYLLFLLILFLDIYKNFNNYLIIFKKKIEIFF